MDKPAPPPQVVAKRQQLNEAAYCAVLRTVTLKRVTGTSVVALLKRLRAELGITSEQHSNWHQQYMSQPPLVCMAGGHVQGQGYQAGPTQQPQGVAPQMAHAVMGGAGQHPQPVAGPGPRAEAARAGLQQQMLGRSASMGTSGMAPGGVPTASAAPKNRPKATKKELAALPPLIGCRVQRWWEKEHGWFMGVVTDYREGDGLYCITYDIGTTKESYEWFNVAAAQHGDPQQTHMKLVDKIDLLKLYPHSRAFTNSRVLKPYHDLVPIVDKPAKRQGGGAKSGGGGSAAGSKKRKVRMESDDEYDE